MKCSGAGIVPIVVIHNKIYIVVFNDHYNMASDAGGKIDEGYTNNENIIKKTALRELFEESSGLIKLSKLDKYIYFDLKNHDNYYRLFFVKIQKFNFKNFDPNLKKINKYKSNPFNEMNKIYLLDMDTIKFLSNNIFIDSDKEKNIKISPRLKFILYQVFNKYNTFKNFYISLEFNRYKFEKKYKNITFKEYYSNKKCIVEDIVTFQSL